MPLHCVGFRDCGLFRRGNASRTRPKVPGFTLVELLVVVAILAILAGILFPVFQSVRARGQQTTCSSNLRQLGMAVQMYAQDYDGYIPFAKDASDAFIPQMWQSSGPCQNLLPAMPFLHPMPGKGPMAQTTGILEPYLRSKDVWKCASDFGFDYLDHNDSCGGPCPLSARPTMFVAFGSSYLFRTELAFRRLSLDSLSGLDQRGGTVGAESIHLLFDGSGSWHGRQVPWSKKMLRYTAVFADGHVSSLIWDRYWEVWSVDVSNGQVGSPCQ
jgi:prepilin-type N-terminal cleavage/methylation domain-containing protein